MSAPDKLTAYQEKCLRLAFVRGRYLLLEHEVALRKLTEAGPPVWPEASRRTSFSGTDGAEFGAVWIHPLPAGIAHIQRRTAYITETI